MWSFRSMPSRSRVRGTLERHDDMAKAALARGARAATSAIMKSGLPRIPIATAVGLLGFASYVVVVVTLADRLTSAPWPVQALYFVVAGSLWVFPIRWLMLWAARLR